MSPLKVATPFVVVAVALLGVAPAGLTVAVTSTPLWLTALPLASRSCTTGCWAKATPLCAVAEGWVVSVSWVAAPAVMVMVPDTTSVSPGAVKCRVRSPTAPLIARSVKLATPLPSVRRGEGAPARRGGGGRGGERRGGGRAGGEGGGAEPALGEPGGGKVGGAAPARAADRETGKVSHAAPKRRRGERPAERPR